MEVNGGYPIRDFTKGPGSSYLCQNVVFGAKDTGKVLDSFLEIRPGLSIGLAGECNETLDGGCEGCVSWRCEASRLGSVCCDRGSRIEFLACVGEEA